MTEKQLRKILYIEDDSASRMLVKQILEEYPFRYFEAGNGMQGLKKCMEIHPDLILMDLNLPDISGNELTTKIKSLPEFKDVVIIAVTGDTTNESRDLSLIAGCAGYITKPINVENFSNQILNFLQGRKENVEVDKQARIHRRYEETLVNHLTAKVEELQNTNHLLTNRTRRLKNYSRKMEALLRLINSLQLCRTCDELKEKLVEEITSRFCYRPCLFFEPASINNPLKISHAAGTADENLPEIEVNGGAENSNEIFRKNPLYLYRRKSRPSNQLVSAIASALKPECFIIAVLGNTAGRLARGNGTNPISHLLAEVIPELNEFPDAEQEILQRHLTEILSTEIFNIGGYLYIDFSNSDNGISAYDVRIFEMLIRAASLIYQNLQLREQLKQLFLKAEKEAITDHLTGLFNYRYFRHHLSLEFARAQRHQSQFACLMIDIDHFKEYNDRFGHQAGDRLLKKLSRIIKANTRSTDIVARYGGEEFVIICPELDRELSLLLAEKLRNIIEKSSFTIEDDFTTQGITISIGVAVYPLKDGSAEKLIRAADLALYRAKKNGRNQVQAYGE